MIRFQNYCLLCLSNARLASFSGSALPGIQVRLKHQQAAPKVVDEFISNGRSSVSVEVDENTRPPDDDVKSSAQFVSHEIRKGSSSFRLLKRKLAARSPFRRTSSSALVDKPLQLLNATDPKLLDTFAPFNFRDLPGYYLGLSKSRLTGLVVVTAMAGYALAPAAFVAAPFLSLTLGTALTSAAANTVNQIIEVPYDSQMDRTKNRVLVRQKLTKLHATTFAVVSGVSGLTILYFGCNGLTALLGGMNLLLYTCAYTPLKRQSIVNTWVGSIVGGIPPLMGWAACTGELCHGALLLGGILYAWQFPHFNALSWNIRNDYKKAGYKMMAVSHPDLCKKTSLRYSLSLVLMSTLAPVCNVTSWTFAVDSLPLNGYLVYLAYRFYKEGDSASSRKLFRFTLVHLPLLILLMMISKKAYSEKRCTNSEVITAIKEQQDSISALIPVTLLETFPIPNLDEQPVLVNSTISETSNITISHLPLESQ